MDLNNYLNDLNADLEHQMQEISNAVNSAIGNIGGVVLHQSSQQEPVAQETMFCPECGARIPVGSKFCGQCGTRIEEPMEQTNAETTEPAVSDAKRFIMIQICMENVRCYDIPDVPEMDELWEYYEDELTEYGLEPEDNVACNLADVIRAIGVETLGNEYSNGPMHYPTSLAQIYVCYDRTHDEWYEYDEEKKIDEFDGFDVDFSPEEHEIIEDGITFIGTQPPCSNCFALYLNEGEEFDLSLLSVSHGWENGSMLIATYNDEELEYLGMGAGDEDNDYLEEVKCYLDGEFIDIDY